jgi:hypothetical protein
MIIYAKLIVSAIVVLVIGIGLIRTIRGRLTPRFPAGATGASIAVTAVTLVLVANLLGLNVAYLFPGIAAVVVFIGAICAQPRLWSPSSILHALAISAGSIAIIAVLTEDYSGSALALLAAGVLIKLYSDISPNQGRASEDIRSGARAV